MAIPVQFQQFKSAGIYRLVYDKSTVLGTEAELLRLVVGYSPKGPFNTPVYIKSTSDFSAMFGDESKTLEKRGCFFHRIAKQMLNAGPILCLNLKPFTTESVGVFGISNNFVPESKNVKDIYDRTRFWKLDPDTLNEDSGSSSRHYMHIAITDSVDTSASFFIRKALHSKVAEYNMSIYDWYKSKGEEVPEYLAGHESDLLSDYFTEIYVFKGEFIPSQIASSSLAKYFQVNEVYTQPTGDDDSTWNCVEIDGKYYDIATVGISPSYEEGVTPITQKYVLLPRSVDVVPVYQYTDDEDKTYIVKQSDAVFVEDNYYLKSSLVYNQESGQYELGEHPIELTVKEYIDTTTNEVYDAETEVTELNGKLYIDSTLQEDEGIKYAISGSIEVHLGDYVIDYDSYDESFNESFDGKNDSYVSNVKIFNTIENSFGDQLDALDELYNDSSSGAIGHYIGCMLPNFIDNNYGYRSIDILFNNDSDLHHMMISLDDDYLDEVGVDGALVGNVALKTQYNLETGESNQLYPCYLKGYTFLNDKPENSTIPAKYKWQQLILNTLKEETGLLKGLLSPSEIEYRYIVDSFDSYYSATDELKSQLSLIAKQKELCFAILNFPSVSNLVKQGATFTNSKGVYDVNKVVKAIKLPSESNGASFCGFFTPLKFSDGYVDTIVPSAGLVSNLFMAKYNGRAAYNIIAGPNYANVQYSGLIGPDYHYSQDELHIIEPFGVNCMVYRPTFGTFINANQTAKQLPKTALSAINVRELVIYLQDEIGKILQSYQWEFNNPTTREAIKNKADIICEAAKKDGGIQEYLNVIDESNNTADIIDNEMCVLSTSIEPGRGMGKMIHELTIYRTGGMSSLITEE